MSLINGWEREPSHLSQLMGKAVARNWNVKSEHGAKQVEETSSDQASLFLSLSDNSYDCILRVTQIKRRPHRSNSNRFNAL
jgi:hypothetical protein